MRNKDAKFNLRFMQTETETETATENVATAFDTATPETGRCEAVDTLNTFCQLTSSDVASTS